MKRRGRVDLPRAVGAFYSAITEIARAKTATARKRRHKRVLVATIDVTGFTPDELTNLRGALQHAAMPRDRHFPARSVSFTVTAKES